MPTWNVVLNEHQHDVVEKLVRSGRYQNASDVLRDGLHLVEQREVALTARFATLQNAAGVGWEDLANGRCVDIPDGQLDAFIASLGAQAQAQQQTSI